MDDSDLIIRIRSMQDYRQDSTELVDLFQRCEATNKESASMTDRQKKSMSLFHCEFTDYLWCMEQYPESYCLELVQSNDNKIIFTTIVNVKRVHLGPHLTVSAFARLARMDPERRRQYLTMNFFLQIEPFMQSLGVDFGLGYTLATNNPSLNLQRALLKSVLKELFHLDIFVVPTTSNIGVPPLKKLTQVETEQLWTVDLADWVHRPVLSDLRRITASKEYVGTFVSGSLPAGSYTAASMWQPTSAILCDDRHDQQKAYRGPYRLIFNLVQSNAPTDDQRETFVNALSNTVAIEGIPFMLCHVERSSPFNEVFRRRALAMTTEILSRRIRSPRMAELGDQYDYSPVWLDPRDFSSLLYFTPVSDKVYSNL